jgi:hypothetical protein
VHYCLSIRHCFLTTPVSADGVNYGVPRLLVLSPGEKRSISVTPRIPYEQFRVAGSGQSRLVLTESDSRPSPPINSASDDGVP